MTIVNLLPDIRASITWYIIIHSKIKVFASGYVIKMEAPNG